MTNEKPDASREAFEKWQSSWPIGRAYGAINGWQACDAAWRKRLQSEEMVEKMCKVYWTTPHSTKEFDDLDDAFKDEMRRGMLDVINAILEENNPYA